MKQQYIGRFAPSPTGPLHLGSLVTAMASFLDAKAHRGLWLLRIEDIDTPGAVPHSDYYIMQQLQRLGLLWDNEVIWQSQRQNAYHTVFQTLQSKQLIYGCNCSRKELTQHAPNHWGEYVYKGTCRYKNLINPRSWRLILNQEIITFHDRYFGVQHQNLSQDVGDIIIRRADSLFSYQFVVVIDDIYQKVNQIVRGEDLLSSTARQYYLHQLLGHPPPQTLHIPLIRDHQGRKLSKQNHAPELNLDYPLETLNHAWSLLNFRPIQAKNIEEFWKTATYQWSHRLKLL